MNPDKKKSLLFFLLLLAIAAINVLWGQSLAQTNTGIRVWNWNSWLILLAGLPFIFIQKEAGLPELIDHTVTNRYRIWQPLLIGFLFAIPDVIIVGFLLHPEPYTTLPPFLQPFPYSLSLYSSGALEIEIFYRLIPITLVLWLISEKLLKGKHREIVFWSIAILTAIREPLEQWPSGSTWFIVYATASGFAMNLWQAYQYRKAGFIGAMMIRYGHYLIWHILLGVYIEFFVLR
ncbi:MAG: hypothetical protein IBJ16_07810 [Chitinophagaceae bacterium]|nr:hypothetical protein [Chitinophagaceae bacterium]